MDVSAMASTLTTVQAGINTAATTYSPYVGGALLAGFGVTLIGWGGTKLFRKFMGAVR